MRVRGALLFLLSVVVLASASCSSARSAAGPADRNTVLWVAMYPVNRALDVLDIVSVSAGLGGGAYANAHVTRAVQVGLGAGGGVDAGWWQDRELGVGTDYIAGAAFGPWMAETEGRSRAGTAGVHTDRLAVQGPCTPTDPVHRVHRDYWGIGARVIALLVGAEVEVHPVEIADAVCGFFLVDFRRDDIGNRRRAAR
jgi:hypothetical protein